MMANSGGYFFFSVSLINQNGAGWGRWRNVVVDVGGLAVDEGEQKNN